MHWLGANPTPPSLSFLSQKVRSGQLSSPIELSLSGHCCLFESLVPSFDQPMRCPEWERIAPAPPSSLAQPLRSLHSSWKYSFEQVPLVCSRLLLLSAQLSTQTNSLTSPETSWVTARGSPSLLPSPVVTRFLNFSGTVPVSNHSPSWDTLPAVCLLLHHYLLSEFKCPGFSWHRSANLALWEGREGSYKVTVTDPVPLQSCWGSRGLQDRALGNPPFSLQNNFTVRF